MLQVVDFEDLRAAARRKLQDNSPETRNRPEAADHIAAKENIPAAETSALSLQESSRKYATIEMKVSRQWS